MSARRFIVIIATLLALAGTALAHGEPRWYEHYREDKARERDQRNERGQRPVNDVIGEVEHNYGGHVVGVQQPQYQNEDEAVYRVRVLQHDGRVKTVTVPAHKKRQ